MTAQTEHDPRRLIDLLDDRTLAEVVVVSARQRGSIRTRFGWRMRITSDATDEAIMNFPMQANAAEMMRLAAIAAAEAGVHVVCPVHDAFLIHCPEELMEAEISQMTDIMRQAARAVIGEDIRVSPKTWTHPERFEDARGVEVWNSVHRLLTSSNLR